MSDTTPGQVIQATVRIAFEDAEGRHDVDDQVAITIENDDQRANLIRLVEQGILAANVPPTPPLPISVPEPDEGHRLVEPVNPPPAPDFRIPGGAHPASAFLPESEPTEQPPPPDDVAEQEPTS